MRDLNYNGLKNEHEKGILIMGTGMGQTPHWTCI